MTRIAGHDFEQGRCSCGRAWLDIRNTSEEEIGAEGIAHIGALSRHEYDTIVALREYENDRIADAMAAVAIGAGR